MSALFAVYALAHAGATTWFWSRGQVRPAPYTMLFIIGIGLTYDNLVLALGSTIGEGSLLLALTYPRHVTHVLLTPMLPVIAVCH